MKNILAAMAAATLFLSLVPFGIVIIAMMLAVALAGIVYQAVTGRSVSMVDYERTTTRTVDGVTTRRTVRRRNGTVDVEREVDHANS